MEQIMLIVLFFLALSVVWMVLYFIPLWIVGKNRKPAYNRAALIKDSPVVKVQKKPDMGKELDIIPIEEAMAVSSNVEKRELLLEQLKKGVDQNYKVILPAGEDSEAAYYVAAAKMEVLRQKREKVENLQVAVKDKGADLAAMHAYLSGLKEYLETGILEEKEAVLYREEYCAYFMKLRKADIAEITEEEVTYYLDSLIFFGDEEEAENVWKICPEDKKSEAGYRLILNMYYNSKDQRKFFRCLKELEDSEIPLSTEGLMLLRFWIARRKQ